MSSTTPDIAVIIVNYGTADLAIAAVESVRSLSKANCDIHVVDNASPGEDAALLKAAHRDRHWGEAVSLYLEDVNHGFGRGNNVVLRALAARADPPSKVMLLNPDAQLSNDAISVLAGFLDAHPRVGFAGAMITQDGDKPVTAAFRFPNTAWTFASAASIGPLTRLCDARRVPLDPILPEGPVDWVAGAAVMIRTETLRQIGLFDDKYFLYFEEVDLMHRAHDAGWETWYVPAARITHLEGAATGVQSGVTERRRRPAYWYDSWRYYFTDHHGRFSAIWTALVWIMGSGLGTLMARLRGRTPPAPLNLTQDLWSHVIKPSLSPERQQDARR